MNTKAQCAKMAPMVIVMSLVAANCAPRVTPTPLPTPGPATGPFPVGSFITDRDDPIGPHMIEYRTDGSYVYQGHGNTAVGTYAVTGDRVTFKDNYCGGVLGTYTWSFDGDTLSFEMLDDTCAARAGVTHLSDWERSP